MAAGNQPEHTICVVFRKIWQIADGAYTHPAIRTMSCPSEQNPIQPPATPLRAVFFGTGDIARPAFASLAGRADITLCGLVTQPDKPVGRHQVLTPPAIKTDALAAGVPVWQPERAGDMTDALAALAPDVFLVMAYGQILPQRLIDVPRLVCWNLHASLLPRHRGASPIQAALLAGDPESGVTVMHVVRALDAGDNVLAARLPVLPGETGGSLHDRLAALAPVAMNKAIDLLVAGRAPRTPQDPALVTVQGKLGRADGELDWHQPAGILARKIHAFDPWPGTSARMEGGKGMKIFPPIAVEEGFGRPGETLAAGPDGLVVACGSGALRITTVQPEGKRRMTVAEYLRGTQGAPRFEIHSPPTL